MEFSPTLYHRFVRPKWFTKRYIHDHILGSFDFTDKTVLDFGAGTGANCSMFDPGKYVGLDPDSSRILYARQLYPTHSFKVLEGNRLLLDNESVDVILIIAVLHHIATGEIARYMKEFSRVLRQGGKIIAIEPYLCKKSPICNWFMQWYDRGEYIREEEDYLHLFKDHNYDCGVLKRFKKCFLYNELFFFAVPKNV